MAGTKGSSGWKGGWKSATATSSSWRSISVSRNSNGSYTVSSWWKSVTAANASSASAAIKSFAGWGSSSSSSSSSSSGWSGGSSSSSRETWTVSSNSWGGWNTNTQKQTTTNTNTNTNTNTSQNNGNSSSQNSTTATLWWVKYTFTDNWNGKVTISDGKNTKTFNSSSKEWQVAMSYLSSKNGTSNTNTTNSVNTTVNNKTTTTKDVSTNWNTVSWILNWNKFSVSLEKDGWYKVTANWNTSKISAEQAKKMWIDTWYSNNKAATSTNTNNTNNNQNNNNTNKNWNIQVQSSNENSITYSVDWRRATLTKNWDSSYTVIDASGNKRTYAADSATWKVLAQQFSNLQGSKISQQLEKWDTWLKLNSDGTTGTYTDANGKKYNISTAADWSVVAVDSNWNRKVFSSISTMKSNLDRYASAKDIVINDNKNTNTNVNKNNEDAIKTILKSEDNQLKTKNLDVWNKKWELTNAEDWSLTYIAPNGKEYPIYNNEQWKSSIKSKVNWEEISFNSLKELQRYIDERNQDDWIDRSNRGTQDIPNGEIEWTYRAPSGKEYDMIQGTGARQGQYWFINNKGEVAWYNSYDEAKSVIDANNPVWSTDLAKNEPLKTREDTNYYDEDNGLAMTGEESIDAANEQNEEWHEEAEEDIGDYKEEATDLTQRLENDSDETYNRKQQIVNTMLWDLDTFTRDINDAIDDLKEKSKLIQDNDRMRRARARARELAAKWYLTSEQVQQVANYSLADYNAELEANALQAAKAIAEIQVQIAQKKQDYLAVVRSQQWNNENDRLTQENLINERFNNILQYVENMKQSADQFYQGNINNNLSMNIQNELWVNSLVKQNDAQNIVDDRNQQRAFTDSTYRRQYIMDHISDANLHAYADRLINDLIKNGKFVFYNKTNEQNKQLLAEQISKIAEGAKLLQQQDTLAANK